MKKILLSSLALLFFSTSLLIFQLSCKKEALAQTQDPCCKQKDLLLFYKYDLSTRVVELWSAKLDGTNQQQINVTLPTNTRITTEMPPMLSPDGNKIFIVLATTVPGQFKNDLYSINSDGSGLVRVVEAAGTNNAIMLGGVY